MTSSRSSSLLSYNYSPAIFYTEKNGHVGVENQIMKGHPGGEDIEMLIVKHNCPSSHPARDHCCVSFHNFLSSLLLSDLYFLCPIKA